MKNSYSGDDCSNPQQGETTTTTAVKKSSGNYNNNNNNNNSSSTAETASYTNNRFKIPPNKRDSRKIFVGGLPAQVSNAEFRVFFEQFGPILDSVVMIDRITRCSRGFGFVTFARSSDATAIIKNNVQDDSKSKVCIRGKWCEVKASEPKSDYHLPNYRGNSRNGTSGRGRSQSTFATGSQQSSRNSSIDTVRGVGQCAEPINVGGDVNNDYGFDGAYYHPDQTIHPYPPNNPTHVPHHHTPYVGHFPHPYQPSYGAPLVAFPPPFLYGNDAMMYGPPQGYGYAYPSVQPLDPIMNMNENENPSDLIHEDQPDTHQ